MKKSPYSSAHEEEPGCCGGNCCRTEDFGLNGSGTTQIAGATATEFGCSFGETGSLGGTEKFQGFAKLVMVLGSVMLVKAEVAQTAAALEDMSVTC